MAANTYNGFGYGEISGGTSPNANLRPLKVKEVEAGLELSLFHNRLRYDGAIYKKNTVDEILNVDISNASGFPTTTVNIGRLRNQGIENLLQLLSGVFKSDVYYSLRTDNNFFSYKSNKRKLQYCLTTWYLN